MSSSFEAQTQLAEYIAQCFDVLNNFGKTPEQLENITGMFLVILGDYRFSVIKSAFQLYMKRSSVMPTPADIINIINPPKQPLSTSMYIQIMKECNAGKFLWGDKREFVVVYEAQEMAKMRGGSEEYREARKEIENHKNLQIEHFA